MDFIRRKLSAYIIIGMIIAVGWAVTSLYKKVDYQLKTHDKSISIINMYGSDINLKINGEEKLIGKNADFVYYINTSNEIEYLITSDTDEILLNAKHNFGKKPNGVINVIQPKDKQSEYCLFSAQVSSFYYESQFPTLYASSYENLDYAIISATAIGDDYEVGESLIKAETMLPGEYSGEKLPDEINPSEKTKIQAIVPVKCSELENKTARSEALVKFLGQDAEEREFN